MLLPLQNLSLVVPAGSVSLETVLIDQTASTTVGAATVVRLLQLFSSNATTAACRLYQQTWAFRLGVTNPPELAAPPVCLVQDGNTVISAGAVARTTATTSAAAAVTAAAHASTTSTTSIVLYETVDSKLHLVTASADASTTVINDGHGAGAGAAVGVGVGPTMSSVFGATAGAPVVVATFGNTFCPNNEHQNKQPGVGSCDQVARKISQVASVMMLMKHSSCPTTPSPPAHRHTSSDHHPHPL